MLVNAVKRRRSEGALGDLKDFMLDRLDDALEPVARMLTGKSSWDEMKAMALAASAPGGAAELVADQVLALLGRVPGLEVHMVGHSAGAIFQAPLLKLLGDRGVLVKTCTLWAPACTVAAFEKYYVPAMAALTLAKLAVYVLSDEVERDDDCAKLYNKSLLYLVSNAFEGQGRIPGSPRLDDFRSGEPILGMARFHTPALAAFFAAHQADVIIAPNDLPASSLFASGARHHGDFDDDERTVQSTFARIMGKPSAAAATTRQGMRSAIKMPGDVVATETPAMAVPLHASGAVTQARRDIIDKMTR